MDNANDIRVWVIDDAPSQSCRERLGDARSLADCMGQHVGVLLVGGSEPDAEQLIQYGADLVLLADSGSMRAEPASIAQQVRTAADTLPTDRPLVVFAGGNPAGREWAALLAAAEGWQLVSPALLVVWRGEQLFATRLDHTGKRSCQVTLDPQQTVVVTMRPGVAEAQPVEVDREGTLRKIELSAATSSIVSSRTIPADPETVDIRHANRLVAGGYGLGGPEGFDLLRRFAKSLDAGVAASRKAVDLGWIDSDRQVGQTGKTVQPKLYIACGISGASHHLQGMSQAEHIVAINTDPEAPIFKTAHLGLVGDLNEVLQQASRGFKA